jgi:hypothetical protein
MHPGAGCECVDYRQTGGRGVDNPEYHVIKRAVTRFIKQSDADFIKPALSLDDLHIPVHVNHPPGIRSKVDSHIILYSLYY